MRKIAYILAAIILSACVSQKDKDKAFITDFYTHVLGIERMTDEYLKASLSKELLDSLWETEYDDCYSYWDFRTGYQDGPSDISEVLDIKVESDGWYEVSYLDMGNRGRTRIHVVKGKITGYSRIEPAN